MKKIKVLASVALLSVALPVSHIDTVMSTNTVKAAVKVGYPTSKYKKGAPVKFSNCKSLNKYYPYGVTYNHKSYAKKLDRDKDKMACEAKAMVFKAWMAKN
ncbi:excalibur calcium-binding domain-containing protein [Macrococcus sp. EM39E]|uniref:excalibur calcium-binding domain-containing protein n=1 Tax=Macrococcus animalis TaxID=3395467 RepID=UPI0039BEBB47